MLSFNTPEEGFDLLQAAYMDSEVTSGEIVDNMLDNGEFDPSIPDVVKYTAIQNFRAWDCQDDFKDMIFSDGKSFILPDGKKVPRKVFVGILVDGEEQLDQGISRV